GPVLAALHAAAGDRDLLALKGRNNYAVVRAVGDEQALAPGIGQHLAGEEQRTVALLGVAGQFEAERGRLELLLRLVRLDQLGDVLVEDVVGPFPGDAAIEVAVGVDQHQRGPGPDAVPVPDGVLGVIDHRVADLVAQDGLADALGVLLVGELRRVYADDDQHAGVFRFEPGEVGEGVDAVDAAQRPEVEQDDAAAQVGELEGGGGVEPGRAAGEFGGGDLAGPLASRGGRGPARREQPEGHQQDRPHKQIPGADGAA